MAIAERVASRYRGRVAASVPKGLVLLIHAVTKAAGGPSFIGSRLDTDAMRSWDKAEFYRSGQDENLLARIIEAAKSQDIYNALEPFWKKSGYHEGVLDDDRLDLDYDEQSEVTLELRAWGPTFRQYSEEADDLPEEERHWYVVEVPEDQAFLDGNLDKLAQLLGGKLGWNRREREGAEFDPGYDQFRYDTQIIWKVNSEDLLRASVGKWIIQAGEAANWTGEALDEDESRLPFAVEKGDVLTIASRRGDWPKDFKRGLKLVVLRDARPRDKVSVVVKGQKDKLYFRVYQDRKGLSLVDLGDSKKVLRVVK